MHSIINRFKITTKSSILIIVACLFIVFLIYILYRSIRLNKYKKQLIELGEKINSIKSLPIKYRLGRVKKISINDSTIDESYQHFIQKVDELDEFYQNQIATNLNIVEEKVYLKRIRKLKSKIKQLYIDVNNYEQLAKKLLHDIEIITEVENIQRMEIVKIKETYRQTCQQYELVKYKIDEFVPLVGKNIHDLEIQFSNLEKLMNQQMYAEAKTESDHLKQLVNNMNACVRDLPTYISIVRNYIPNHIDKLYQKINEMNQHGFCLERLNIDVRYQEITTQLPIIIENIQSLHIETVGKDIEEVTKNIDSIKQDLEHEENAHQEYLAIWKGIFHKINEIHEDYKYALTEYRKLNERYKLNDKLLDVSNSYPTLEQILEETKELENLIQTNDFSYSTMVEKLKQLLQKAESYESNLRYFFVARDELYLTEQRAVDELDSINIVLLEIKSEIKNMNLPSISKEYKRYISEAYDRSNRIQLLRNELPIDLERLTAQADEARDIIYQLYENIHNLITTAKMVEETIIYGNRYRSSFLEVNTELTKAEILYRNGDYSEALKIAVAIVEKIQPGFNQQLLDKKNKFL